MFLVRTALLMGLLTGILLLIGYLLAGVSGMTFFLILAFVLNFLSFWFSDKIVMAMYRAKEIPKNKDPQLHKIVENVSKEIGIPKPKIYSVDINVPNAFATGRSPKSAAIAVTSGLMKALDKDEVEGVIAHELSHVKNRDTLTSVIAATIGGAIAYIAQMAWWGLSARREGNSAILLPLLILAPLAAMLVQLAISRGREYAADYTGAVTIKKPLSLASALEKIDRIAKAHPLSGNTATSHLWIVNPFKADSLAGLFMTHPPTAKRVERLKELANNM